MSAVSGKYLRLLLPLVLFVLLSLPPPDRSVHTDPPPETIDQLIPFPEDLNALEESEEASREYSPPVYGHIIEDCIVTYYDVCILCCGKDNGITASGAAAVPYETCAVDPEVIPLGTRVVVDFGDGTVFHLRAGDTGSGVRGDHIDICVSGHEEALSLGVRRADVYWEK